MSDTVPVKLPQRVIAYVDGFNLYYGLKSKGWRRYYWLDLPALCSNLLQDNQQLLLTKYFTARVSSPADTRKRQSDYLEALQTRQNLEIFFGQYLPKTQHCRACGTNNFSAEEKMTDVNIAVQILCDAFQNRFDTALILSADSDLVPPIQAVKTLFPNKRVLVGFPPHRSSKELMNIASAYFTLGRAKIAQSQLPDSISKTDGVLLSRPNSWR